MLINALKCISTNSIIDVSYCSDSSGEETTDNNVRLETPVSNNTMNKSGTDKLYKLEEQDKKRAKEEKKEKKKKEKKEKVLNLIQIE